MQHEVVVPARDRQRVELDRPEAAEDFQNCVGSSVERACRREQLTRDEKAARGLGGDLQDEFARS
jgi:hypothetical protein